MKKYLLGFLALVFPFVFFLFVDLPGAALVALGLQSTIIGWPIAAIWAFKHLSKVLEDDELKHAAATAAAAAEATVKAKAEAEAKVKAEMAAEERVKAEAEAKVRAEMKTAAEADKIRAEAEAKVRAEMKAQAEAEAKK